MPVPETVFGQVSKDKAVSMKVGDGFEDHGLVSKDERTTLAFQFKESFGFKHHAEGTQVAL